MAASKGNEMCSSAFVKWNIIILCLYSFCTRFLVFDKDGYGISTIGKCWFHFCETKEAQSKVPVVVLTVETYTAGTRENFV